MGEKIIHKSELIDKSNIRIPGPIHPLILVPQGEGGTTYKRTGVFIGPCRG